EDLTDVRVAERGGDARLVEEHLDELLVLLDVGEDLLDRDELAEAARAGGVREEKLGHASHREAGENLVLTDAPPAIEVRGHGARRHKWPRMLARALEFA